MSILSNRFIPRIINFLKPKIEAKQDKLVSGTNIKTINGTSLLGSGDVSISGDASGSVDEGRLAWSEEAVPQGTIIDGIMYNAHQNGLAFMNPSCIDVYYSIDNGDTWQDYGLTTTQKVYLVTPVTGSYSLYLGKDSTNKSVNYRLRVDLRIKDADIQFTGKKLYLKWLSNTSSDAYYIDISVLKYENYESNEWTYVGTFHKKNTLTIPLNGVMGYNGAGGILSLRIETYRTGTTEPRYNSALANIAFLYTVYTKGNSFGKTGLPMTIDTSQNAIFPAYIKARKLISNGGKSTQVVKGDGSLEEESALAVACAIDAEHAIEADYAGVADKADKLTNPRTISLSGGVTSTATAFDGSKDVSVPVTSLQENALVWSANDIQNGTTIMDSMFRDTIGNRLAFCNPAAITIEHSQDGGVTWVSIDNDADKIKLVTPVLGDNNFTIGGSETPPNRDVVQTRVTIDAITANLYFVVNKILIMTIGVTGVDSDAGKPTFCKIEYQTYPNYGTDTWTTYKDIEVIGQPGWNSISTNGLPKFGYTSVSHIRLIRFTFYKPNGCGQYIGRLSNIAFLATKLTQGGNTFSNTGHIYEIDVNQNATFPANITASNFNGVNISVNNNVKGKTLNIGTNTTLSNSGTAAIGGSCSATNPYAIAMGYKAVSSGYYSTAIGTVVTAPTNYQTVIGKYNDTSTHAFVIGWGTADAKKNIFSVDTSGNVYGTKFITSGGTNQQVVLGDGSLRPISELSPITDADAEILLDNHIHSINVNANGNNVNINVIESSKSGNNWETEDNDIPIPLATPTSAGVMSKEDKIKSDGLLIYYHLTEDEYTNHELVSLYPLVLAIKDKLFNSTTNKWKYDDSKSYDVRVKGWTLQDNGITYLNVNVRLLTSQGGHSIGFSGFADVDFITETYFDALIPLYIGYICGKYHIEDDGMTVVAPEDSGFYIEI